MPTDMKLNADGMRAAWSAAFPGYPKELSRMTALEAGIRAYLAATPSPVSGEVERVVEWWQPIKTAPADTELLLGWWRLWPIQEWRQEIDIARGSRGGWRHGQATHWRPLPAPPDLAAYERSMP